MKSFNLGAEMLTKLCEDAWNGADLSDRFLLFLDFDGVLNHQHTQTLHDGYLGLDPKCMALFNEFVQETKPLIVISSTWRIGETIEGLRFILCDEFGFKFPDLVIGRTTSNLSKNGQFLGRGGEIDEWLKQFPGKAPKAFVIVDDDSFDMDPHMERLVQTSFKTGLTESHIPQLREKLGLQ